MTPAEIIDGVRMMYEAAALGASPEPGTGYVDEYERGRADGIREVLDELRRRLQ